MLQLRSYSDLDCMGSNVVAIVIGSWLVAVRIYFKDVLELLSFPMYLNKLADPALFCFEER